MKSPNPFRPTSGTRPHTLAGRSEVLSRIAGVFTLREGDPDATMVITGHRGTGKTVLLNSAVQMAHEQKWAAVSISAADGPVARALIEAVTASKTTNRRRGTRLTGAQALGFGLSWSPPAHTDNPSLRYILTDLTEQTAKSGTGLLIALDEMQHLKVDKAREFASALQHVIRNEGRPAVFIGAGLTVIESTILADAGMTFFGRCARAPIGPLSDHYARQAIREPLEDSGSSIDKETLDAVINAARGYPFMLQQVGYHIWETAPNPSSGITLDTAQAGIASAQDAMENKVLRPDWARLGAIERKALTAMSRDAGPTRTASLRSRLEMSSSKWGVYRKRLLDAGVIVAPQRGQIDFAHEPMRELVRKQTDTEEDSDKEPTQLSDLIIAALEADKRASYAATGRKIGASRSYVRQIARINRLTR